MKQKIYPSSSEMVYRALHQRQLQDITIETPVEETSAYWKLSDLAILYPSWFDVKHPISKTISNKLTDTILTSLPDFKELTEQPIHILNIHETYNAFDTETNKIKTIKNGLNQKLSRVACEYIFRQIKGTELQQAFFMYPNKDIDELAISAQELHFERTRDQIAESSNILSAIINRSIGSNKQSFSEVWATFWRALYNVSNMDELRARYNIKTSPIDYMTPQTLIFMNGILQEIILQFCNKRPVHIQEIIDFAYNKGLFARTRFIKYGAKPEEKLTNKNSYYTLTKIRKAREKFWSQYYPISLQQR